MRMTRQISEFGPSAGVSIITSPVHGFDHKVRLRALHGLRASTRSAREPADAARAQDDRGRGTRGLCASHVSSTGSASYVLAVGCLPGCASNGRRGTPRLARGATTAIRSMTTISSRHRIDKIATSLGAAGVSSDTASNATPAVAAAPILEGVRVIVSTTDPS
jgi:hypothetical protein